MNTAEITSISTRTPHALDVTNTFAYPSGRNTHKDWQVREDRSFYVPDLLSDKNYDTDPKAQDAAGDYAKHLRKVEGLICEVQDLVGLMRAAISDESDARAMQADTALTIIEKKLRKINNGVDRHDRRHTNLFLAYVDLKGKADEDAE